MIRKVLIVLFIMFAVKFFFSCQTSTGGGCGNSDRVFTEMVAEVYERSDTVYLDIEPDQEIVKDNFVISISFESDAVASTRVNPFFKSLNLGFQSSYAFYDCLPSAYVNFVSNVIVYAIDEETEQRVEVTDSFNIEVYNSTTSISDFFLYENDYLDNFLLTLIDGENIPNSTSFEIEAILTSEEILTSETAVVNFKE